MRLLHVITGLGLGGAEMMLVRLVEQLQALGHTNAVLSLSDLDSLRTPLERAGAEVRFAGLRLGRVPGTGALQPVRAVLQFRPDLVQGWMYHGNLAASFGTWLSLAGCPVVWGVHSSIVATGQHRRLTEAVIKVGALLSRTPAAIVFCSHSGKEQHEGVGFAAGRGLVIPNGIDCDAFQPDAGAGFRLRALLGIPDDRPLVGMVGRYHPMKDHANLLAATARLHAQGRRCHLVLVGDDIAAGNATLVAACVRHGLSRHVSLLGPRSDVAALLPGLDLFVLPSAWGEAFPLALGEAMAAGVACVATDVGDCAWIVRDPRRIAPPGDPAALAAAMAFTLDLPAETRRALGSAGRGRALAEFALPETTRRYQQLYRRLARPRNGERTGDLPDDA